MSACSAQQPTVCVIGHKALIQCSERWGAGAALAFDILFDLAPMPRIGGVRSNRRPGCDHGSRGHLDAVCRGEVRRMGPAGYGRRVATGCLGKFGQDRKRKFSNAFKVRFN